MRDRLCLGICESFAQEAHEVLSREGWTDVSIRPFPCSCALAGRRPPETLRPTLARDEDCDELHLIGSSCLHGAESSETSGPRVVVHRRDPCFAALAPSSLIEQWVAQGCCLITPGWLARWRERIRAMGFDEPTAREFFRESARSLLLLDTGVAGDGAPPLAELGAFLDLPAASVSVGLDTLRSLLDRIVRDWRHRRTLAERDSTAEGAARRTADYATALDVFEKLAGLDTEEQIVSQIVELFSMLLAPGQIACALVERDVARIVLPSADRVAGEVRGEIQRFVEGAHDDFAAAHSGSGFLAGIRRDGELLAVIHIEDIAFPEYRDRYLDLARAINGVCGLVLTHARAHARLRKLDEERIRSSRLEGIGILAAGIAHDFNNMLAVIMGHANLLASRKEADTDAREAMAGGGVFTLRTAVEGERALLSVTDTGTGMDPATVEGLFQPYFTTREFGRSAGWGLAVSLGIVRQHDGSLEVSSSVGQGSTFTLTLPLRA